MKIKLVLFLLCMCFSVFASAETTTQLSKSLNTVVTHTDGCEIEIRNESGQNVFYYTRFENLRIDHGIMYPSTTPLRFNLRYDNTCHKNMYVLLEDTATENIFYSAYVGSGSVIQIVR